MRIIIVGAGKVGSTVANQLSLEGHDVTIVEAREEVLVEIQNAADVAVLHGSGSDVNILREAGVNAADLLIALTGNDELNLLCCLIAKKLGAVNTIARVRQPDYNEVTPIIKSDLGLSMTINPERETALEIARILELPMASSVETFAGRKVEMVGYEVSHESPLCGKQVKDAFARMRAALVCTVERGSKVFIPRGDFRFEAGDVMTIIAPAGKLSQFFSEMGVKNQRVKRILISGGGRTCYYLAQQLLRSPQKVMITIIESDPATAHRLNEALEDVEVCLADGTSQYVLEENGLANADAFCCLTGIDEENILCALYAKQLSPRIKTVTKVNRVELVPIVKPIGIGSIVSPKMIAADRVVSYVRAKRSSMGSGVLTMYRIIENKAEAIEFEVSADSRLINKPIHTLALRDDVLIACINRAGQIISPRGNDTLQAHDTVIVATTHAGFDVLDDIIRG